VTAKEMIVTLPGCTVGTLTQNRSGLVQWIPDAAWQRSDQHPRLGLSFLSNRNLISHASDLPAWFENLLPERDSPLRNRLCGLHGIRAGQSFELMRVLGADLIGAVEVHSSGDQRRELESKFDTEPDPDVLHMQSDGPMRLSSLTGMQLKFSMSMLNDRLCLPATAGATRWIVKIPGAEYDDLAEVECATMSWARAAGFDVPDHQVVNVADLSGLPQGWVSSDTVTAFAVKRFDRRSDDDSKVHQEDFCQALNLPSSGKYGERPHAVSYEGALRLVVDACGEDEGKEMSRRIGFMIASGNSDAHLKNWSFLWGDRSRPVLTPSYDLVSTIAWREKLGWGLRAGPQLALSLGGEKMFKNLDRSTLHAATKKVGHFWVLEEILNGIERAKRTWQDVEASAPDRMRRAIAEHLTNVPVLA
jgi:serine/threonine-protein kinase HipA